MRSVVQVIKKSGSSKQMVMFPFGGGSGYSFMELVKEITADAEVIVINPPGHMFNNGKPLESIDAMAYLYSRELLPLLKENCLFFGHSIGALVAYEMCRDLERKLNIKKLIISSVNPPHCVMAEVDMHSGMDTPQLIQKSIKMGGMPEIFKEDSDLLEKFIAGLRADLKALERYDGGKWADAGKIGTGGLVLYSDGDYIVDPLKVREWNRYLDCSDFVQFSGDHFYLFEPANLKAVARLLSTQINMG